MSKLNGKYRNNLIFINGYNRRLCNMMKMCIKVHDYVRVTTIALPLQHGRPIVSHVGAAVVHPQPEDLVVPGGRTSGVRKGLSKARRAK